MLVDHVFVLSSFFHLLPGIYKLIMKLIMIANKYLHLSKEISKYLELPPDCYISELKEAIEIKSHKNKVNSTNKENINPKKTVIYLDAKGKKLFNIKSSVVDINCLVDLIIFNL
jgi:hypothetical protein